MTITYDPTHGTYLDEKHVRDEMTRVFDVCHGCQRCLSLCSAFPTMISLVDAQPGQDAGRLTPAQQDRVVDECFDCKLCVVGCPYAPGRHEEAIDVPRLVLRARAMRYATKQVPPRRRLTTALLGRTDLVGRAATAASRPVNAVTGAKPGSLARKVLEQVTGVSSRRMIAPFARQRFSAWFATRPKVRLARRQGRVALFPTCLIEYQAPEIGQDVVKVFERNGVECALPEGVGCCGAPALHGGDIRRFTRLARKNVAALAREARAGRDIVAPQPTCGFVLRRDYPAYVGGADAQLVASRTYDAAEYLIKLHKDESTTLDLGFTGDVPDTVTYHTPTHLRAQDIGLKSRDLLKLTGAKVRMAQHSSGVDAMWGLRAENAAIGLRVAEKLGEAVRRAQGDVVAGDCHLANRVITEQTGLQPVHPLQVVARAYGIPPE